MIFQSTQNRWLLIRFGIFLLLLKVKRPGRLFRQIRYYMCDYSALESLKILCVTYHQRRPLHSSFPSLIYTLIYLLSTPLQDIHQTNSGWLWNKNGNVSVVWWNIRTFKYLWFWNPKSLQVSWNVTVELLECPSAPDSPGNQSTVDSKSFTIRAVGLTDEVAVEVKPLCQCACQADDKLVRNSLECSANGTLECGICACNAGFQGQKCECQIAGESSDHTAGCVST